MKSVYVWLTFPDGKNVLCGEIICDDPDSKGRVDGVFKYSDAYLAHPKSFPIDPVSLPLSDRDRQAIQQVS